MGQAWDNGGRQAPDCRIKDPPPSLNDPPRPAMPTSNDANTQAQSACNLLEAKQAAAKNCNYNCTILRPSSLVWPVVYHGERVLEDLGL